MARRGELKVGQRKTSDRTFREVTHGWGGGLLRGRDTGWAWEAGAESWEVGQQNQAGPRPEGGEGFSEKGMLQLGVEE